MKGERMSEHERRGVSTPDGFERRDAGGSEGNAFRVRTQLELRSAGEGSKMPGLVGYSAVFDSWSEPLGFFEDFREKIAPGAFEKTIKESDIRGLFNHSPDHVLGRTRPESERNTLTLAEDSGGLELDIKELPDNTAGRDVAESVERGDVDGQSFGFRTVRDEWEYDDISDDDKLAGVEAYRTLLELRLFDVGPVTYPAYPETTAEVRSKIAGLRAHRDSRQDFAPPFLRSYKHRLAELEARGGVSLS